MQLDLIDALIDAGASPDGNPDNALVNGNVAAAAHLVERGATLTLATALCLARWDDVERLAAASARERQFGLILAALRGRADAVARAIDLGVDLNDPSPDLYSHATALHHAVYLGFTRCREGAGGSRSALDATDTIYGGTPLGWAEHGKHLEIAEFLRERGRK